jgi:DNA-binding CsgD family transcriptional regulator
MSNKEMARTLSVSENTGKTHLANLYAKLGAGRRTEALTIAQRHRLIG